MSLTDDQLIRAVSPYLRDDWTGIGVVGSVARGEAVYSDIDYWVTVEGRELSSRDRYRLVWDDEFGLLSVSHFCVEDRLRDFGKASEAIFLVKAARGIRILEDVRGDLERIRVAGDEFKWDSVRAEAEKEALESLVGLTEEMAKAGRGLETGNREMAVRAAMSITLTLPRIIAMTEGILFESENDLSNPLSMRSGKGWTRNYRKATGIFRD